MKIAGLKNDGAWYRNNKRIKKLNALPPNDSAGLATVIEQLDTLASFIAGMNDLATKTGNAVPTELADANSYATQLATKGIPREVWLGKLTFDTYTPDPDDPKNFLPDHADIVRLFANDLRKAVSTFFNARRTLLDVENAVSRPLGNPSGVADATKNT